MQYVIERDNGLTMRFTGELLASASTQQPGRLRWTELELYKTVGGKYICVRLGQTRKTDEAVKRSAIVADDHYQVTEFFGDGVISKKIYDIAGIGGIIDIE